MKYNVVIIGAGPAGLSAGIFCARAGLSVLCLEKFAVGGQLAKINNLDNYPGVANLSGDVLTKQMQQQVKELGVQIELATVKKLSKTKTGFKIECRNNIYEAEQVIIACGCKVRKLGLDTEDTLTGCGISYCASCDGLMYKGKTVAVVGGGKSAIEDVKYLSHIAKQVYVINRRDIFRAGEYELQKIKKLKNVKIITPATVVDTYTTQKKFMQLLTGVKINHNGVEKQLDIDGLFIAIGAEPDLSFVNIKLDTDNLGYIKTDNSMRTSVKNLYACGDIISKDFRQVVNACAEGATAGNTCVEDR